MQTTSNGARLTLEGTDISLPVIKDNIGFTGIDITRLRSETGLVTYDPGLGNTATCQSHICTANGEKGTLSYRGYDIADLVENCDFIEVAYLLVKGELPTPLQRKNYMELLNRNSLLHIDMTSFFRDYPQHAHPMSILAAMVASLSSFYPEMEDKDPEENIDLTVTNLMSKMRTIAAFTYRQQNGLEFVNPSYKYSYCENLLNMLFSTPVVEYTPNPVHVKALNQLLILHADHEQNCSTTAVRLVASSEANLYASVTAGICALWGSKHGGANQAVMQMLQSIKDSGLTAEQVIEKSKDKSSNFRLYGFGHRVYKTYDPRARIAKRMCSEVLATQKGSDELLDIATRLEELALKDDYFISRHLYPNVDFYTGIILHAMGFPENMFTVMFAVGRLPGWIAHYLEWNHDPSSKIARPRQLYDGPGVRKVIPIAER
jgi:citrate synthase